MLRERLDRHQRLERLRQLPILGELGLVELCPLADEPQGRVAAATRSAR